jgi:hypothetical protein
VSVEIVKLVDLKVFACKKKVISFFGQWGGLFRSHVLSGCGRPAGSVRGLGLKFWVWTSFDASNRNYVGTVICSLSICQGIVPFGRGGRETLPSSILASCIFWANTVLSWGLALKDSIVFYGIRCERKQTRKKVVPGGFGHQEAF